MAQFKEYLEEEGVPTEDTTVTITLPVILNNIDKKLKILRVEKGYSFKRDGLNFVLDLPSSYLLKNKVAVDWYPRVQSIQSKGTKVSETIAIHEDKLTQKHTAFLNFDELFFEAQKFKNERSWYNLSITKEIIIKLFDSSEWYTLFIPPEEMEFEKTIGFKSVSRWQEIAGILLKKYIDKYYKWKKCEWESKHLEYAEIDESSGNMAVEYEIIVEQDETAVIEKIEQLKVYLKEAKENGGLKDFEFKNFKGRFQAFGFERHLYNPLIHISKGSMNIKVKPVSLNEGERTFVLTLKSYFENNKNFFEDKELYLLRNNSGSEGIGFFEADNFYPDFVMWLIHEGKQYVTFIDPKGLRNLKGIKDAKIEFGKRIKEIQERLNEKDNDIVLNSFIISVTEYDEVKWWIECMSKVDFAKSNVLFLSDGDKCIEQIVRKVLK